MVSSRTVGFSVEWYDRKVLIRRSPIRPIAHHSIKVVYDTSHRIPSNSYTTHCTPFHESPPRQLHTVETALSYNEFTHNATRHLHSAMSPCRGQQRSDGLNVFHVFLSLSVPIAFSYSRSEISPLNVEK